MEQLIKISTFILEGFLQIWPYLLITIPLAVAVQLSGTTKYIKRIMGQQPIISILLATLVGAFSPFCSCGVIPIIASLLWGGVPLAPVMSFWIASPSMDPEIFFLSAASIGWELSVWRLVATFFISLSAGYITHYVFKKGALGKAILRIDSKAPSAPPLKSIWKHIKSAARYLSSPARSPKEVTLELTGINNQPGRSNIHCCITTDEGEADLLTHPIQNHQDSCSDCSREQTASASFMNKFLNESWNASFLVFKFMALAFFINALITLYIPPNFITELLGGEGIWSVFIATIVGIPAYTSNMTALPLVSGLLTLGMNKGAALAFLIAGPTTTLPAILAVWGIVSRRIFFLYISFSLTGALIFGLLYNFMS